MKIIISPAKKMQTDLDTFSALTKPQQEEQAKTIMQYLKAQDIDTLKKIWHVNDKLFELNYKRLMDMDFDAEIKTPAILAFSGLQYQYMAPDILTMDGLEFLQKHLRILSSFYGVLRPFDGILPYRLEMKAKVQVNNTKNLHQYWGNSWAEILTAHDDLIINLASKMYGTQVSRYLKGSNTKFVSCVFGRYDLQKQKVIQDNTYAKMARGEMVRFIAENQLDDYHDLTKFNDFGYQYKEEYSTDTQLVFLRDRDN